MAADRDTQTRPATTASRELPRPAEAGAGYRICVVCLGNICRSPTAEVILRDELDRAGLGGRVTVESAGTGDWHIGGPMDPGARAELARRGYDGSAHVARQVTAGWGDAYDLFVVMDRMNLANLRRMFADGPAQARIRLMRSFDPAAPDGAEVPDPYHGTPAEYGAAFDLVLAAARGLAGELAGLLADEAGRTGNGSPGTGTSGTGGNVSPGTGGPGTGGNVSPGTGGPGTGRTGSPGPGSLGAGGSASRP